MTKLLAAPSKLFLTIVTSVLFVFLLIGYVLGIFAFLPKISILAFLILISFILKSERQFFRDWFLFLTVVYLSDTMRGLIYYLTSLYQRPVYCEYALKIETSIFGQVPSVWLQNLLLSDGQTGWFEETLTFFHGTHFIAFLIVGFLIWLKDKEYFKQYKTSFYILLGAGISLYALVPTAPPWMASELFGLLPKLTHFNIDIYTTYIPDLTAGFNTDPVAAMPSLHAAFPFLCCLLLWEKSRIRAWPFYIYTGLIFFTIIYTGDHYVIDIGAGCLLAYLSFLTAYKLIKKRTITQNTNPDPSRKVLNKSALISGVLIILFSLSVGHHIKPELKRYYAEFGHLKFPDFTNHPEKAESSYYLAAYLGDFYSSKADRIKALKYYKLSLQLAPNIYERKRIEKKISLL